MSTIAKQADRGVVAKDPDLSPGPADGAECAPAAAPESVAAALLARLKAHGVEHFYVGAGTDTAPIIEAYAAALADGGGARYPEPVIATHENLAIGMAHGYALVTGRPQAVMLHVSVGTANALCGLMNAARAQVPMLFMAGRTPVFEQGPTGARDSEIHWGQEMFDQHAMLRELVKWDYELRGGAQLHDVLDRAFAISRTAPQGPVALALPRETLAAPMSHDAIPPIMQAVPTPAAPDERAVEQLAEAFSRAQFPVILCTGSGADPSTLPMLAVLAERFGIGIGEARSRFVCFPGSHPLHLGHDMSDVHEKADVLLYLESDVPWVPSRSQPARGAYVAHAGADPSFSRYPIRSHRSSLSITCSVASLLPALTRALERRMTADSVAPRRERIEHEASRLRTRMQTRLQQEADRRGPISKAFLSLCLFEALPDGGIIVNEYPAVREALPFDEPGRYYVHPTSAGLGWGLPAALGVQQASSGRPVVAFLGDGAYLFANPAACHHAATLHRLPVLTIVFDNGGWEAVQKSALLVYPQSSAAAAAREGTIAALASLDPLPDFRLYAEASGGLGLRVDERSSLPGVLKQAFDAVAGGRQALLHVVGRG